MRNKTGTAFMILGTALVLAALSLFLWNQREAERAEAAVEEILPQLIARIETAAPADLSGGLELEDDDITEASDGTAAVEIDGYTYMGYLSIPTLGLELPVMSEWDYTRLKVAPCRYTGSVGTGDLVIAAHNYARHFGTIKSLSVGDPVYFADIGGNVFAYQVAELDILAPTAIEEMTAGEYALTLFTCTYGGQSRVTVRCDWAEE